MIVWVPYFHRHLMILSNSHAGRDKMTASRESSKRSRMPSVSLRTIPLCVTAIAIFLPYPTQVSPPIHINVIDEVGNGIPAVQATWRGGFYAHSFWERVQSDQQGRIRLPARIARLSLAARVLNALKVLIPHGGTRSSIASINIEVPTSHCFDLDSHPWELIGESSINSIQKNVHTKGLWTVTYNDNYNNARNNQARIATGSIATKSIHLPSVVCIENRNPTVRNLEEYDLILNRAN